MNRYDEWRRERDWRASDRDPSDRNQRDRDHGRRDEQSRDEQRQRSSFHPGNHGFDDNSASGRTAGGDDRQPYSQNSYGRYPGERYGQREPYNSRDYGGSRYSESQYVTSRRPSYETGRSGLESEFDRGSRFDRSPFGDTHDRPRYFGAGNYADGGASYGGGFDERETQRPYGSLYGGETSHLEEQYRAPEQPRYRSGPKGYTRSDDRLREEISERLMMADSIDSSEVSVVVKEAKVTLEGAVPTRRMKHAIEDLADQCPGVQDVDNRIRVQMTSSGTTFGGRGRAE